MKTTQNTSPTMVGTGGGRSTTFAWKMDMEAVRQSVGLKPDEEATVAAWVIRAPWAHPFWSDYMLYCIHLRDIPGQSKRPHIAKPGATHEIGLYALSPDHTPCLDGTEGPRLLTPVNYIGQFIAQNDSHANDIITHTVEMICNGELNPDTDARKHWIQLFGADCFKETTTEMDKLLAEGGGAIMVDGKPIMQWEGQEPPPKPTAH